MKIETITQTVYVSNDGMHYDTEEDCLKHEKEIEDYIDKKIALVPHHFECQADLLFGIGMDDYILCIRLNRLGLFKFKACDTTRLYRQFCKRTVACPRRELEGGRVTHYENCTRW